MLDAGLVLGCDGLGTGWCSVLLMHGMNRAGSVEQAGLLDVLLVRPRPEFLVERPCIS